MILIRWLFITLYAIATTLPAMVLTPIVVLLFADPGTGRLARPFRWMETPDCLLPGDPNHVGRPSTEYDLSGWYWTAMRWLWRNPAYRATDWAKFRPLLAQPGTAVNMMASLVRLAGDAAITESPYRGGFFYAVMDSGSERVFELYILIKWPFIDRCIRLRLGWKLAPWFNGKRYVPTDADGMHVFSINPWMRCN
jgi:hypothetical protein